MSRLPTRLSAPVGERFEGSPGTWTAIITHGRALFEAGKNPVEERKKECLVSLSRDTWRTVSVLERKLHAEFCQLQMVQSLERLQV